jgi:hypothetical protein
MHFIVSPVKEGGGEGEMVVGKGKQQGTGFILKRINK